MLDCRQDTLVFVLLTRLPPHTLDPSEPISLSSSSDHRHGSSNPCLVCLSQQTVAGFLVHHLRRASFWDDSHADHLMQCAAYGLSLTGWPPHPFNLWSNAGSTHKSIPQTQTSGYNAEHVTQTSLFDHAMLFWVEPVLLNLYGLGHHAAAQFQGLAILL